MALAVLADPLDQARHGDDDDFTACIQASLPYNVHLFRARFVS